MKRILPWALALAAIAAAAGIGYYFHQQRGADPAARMGKGGFSKAGGPVPVVGCPRRPPTSRWCWTPWAR